MNCVVKSRDSEARLPGSFSGGCGCWSARGIWPGGGCGQLPPLGNSLRPPGTHKVLSSCHNTTLKPQPSERVSVFWVSIYLIPPSDSSRLMPGPCPTKPTEVVLAGIIHCLRHPKDGMHPKDKMHYSPSPPYPHVFLLISSLNHLAWICCSSPSTIFFTA